MYGGGDGGADAARQQEEQRQARVQAAVDTINGIFANKPTHSFSGKVSQLTPGTTVYDDLGNQYTVPAASSTDNSPPESSDGSDQMLSNMVKAAAYQQQVGPLNDLMKQGRLYSAMTENGPAGKSRDDLYREQKQAVYDLNKLDVDKQYKEAERQNRFGLARAGLAGGSADVDSNAEIQDRTNKGLLQASALGDKAASDLKTADERTRQSLISMAQSGVDTGTAQQMAMRQLDATQQAAAGDRQGAAVGNLFGDMSQAYLINQQRAGMRAGLTPTTQQTYASLNTRGGDAGSVYGR